MSRENANVIVILRQRRADLYHYPVRDKFKSSRSLEKETPLLRPIVTERHSSEQQCFEITARNHDLGNENIGHVTTASSIINMRLAGPAGDLPLGPLRRHRLFLFLSLAPLLPSFFSLSLSFSLCPFTSGLCQNKTGA